MDIEYVCSGCGEDIEYYVLAGIAIKYNNLVFCDDWCLEGWQIAIQEKEELKHDDTGY